MGPDKPQLLFCDSQSVVDKGCWAVGIAVLGSATRVQARLTSLSRFAAEATVPTVEPHKLWRKLFQI